MSVVPAMLAERLDAALLTFASSVTVDPAASKVTITRVTEAGVDEMYASFPCVISVVEKINEPRYPSFKGIMAAKKKVITVKTLSDIAISPDQVGSSASWSTVKDAVLRPARSAGIKVEDGGDGGAKLVDYLAEKRVV
jgi:electron transfer flavoprotein beta subunit